MFLVGCDLRYTSRCAMSCDECNDNESCVNYISAFCPHGCLEQGSIWNTTLNFNGSYTWVNNTKESPIIECEREMKIIQDKYWGNTPCYRCKDLNKSIWEGIIPAGDWIC